MTDWNNDRIRQELATCEQAADVDALIYQMRDELQAKITADRAWMQRVHAELTWRAKAGSFHAQELLEAAPEWLTGTAGEAQGTVEN